MGQIEELYIEDYPFRTTGGEVVRGDLNVHAYLEDMTHGEVMLDMDWVGACSNGHPLSAQDLIGNVNATTVTQTIPCIGHTHEVARYDCDICTAEMSDGVVEPDYITLEPRVSAVSYRVSFEAKGFGFTPAAEIEVDVSRLEVWVNEEWVRLVDKNTAILRLIAGVKDGSEVSALYGLEPKEKEDDGT